jgi:superfamily II DNA helicase RecQ
VKHPELDFAGFTLEDFIQFGARRINALRANADLSKFVVGASFSGYACARCDVCFCRKDNAMKHTAARNNNCKLSDIGSCAIFETVCGRTVQASKILAATVPCGATVPLSTTRDWLDKYMADDEKADRYIPIFHPMSQHGNGDKVISDFIDLWTKEPSASEPALLEILELGRIWLLERVRLETGIVHANYRAAIMVFEGQDEGDVKQNTTYNFRHNANALLPELLGLLKFAWRRADQWGVGSGLSGFKQSYDKVRTNPFLVAQILHTLFVQNIQNFYQHPIAVEYCLSRCFRKRAALLSMVKCDLSSTQVAGVLSLLRAGTCGFLLSLNQHAQQIAPNACRLVRTGAVMNTLCPFIRTLKEMHAAKNTKRMKTVSPEGNIAVDGFLFKESIWSELIPRVFDECKKLLTKLLAGNHWLPVLESSIALTVDLGSCRSIGFQLRLADGTIINSTSISVVPVLEAVDLDRLASFLSIAFFGLGCGAMRGSELKESFFADANWHRNTFYYTSQPTKTYSSMAPTTHKKVEHKLPSSLARCFLLFRYILNSQGGLMDLKELVPTRVRATHSMKEAITEVFNFDQVPNKTQIRHFFTSLTDVIFPDSNLDGALNAVPEVAEMSGHSHVTHRVSYPTIVFDGRELIYSKYHLRLGVDCSPSQSLQLQTDCLELTKTELLQSLRILAGPTAEYLSVEQEQMVSIAASTTTDHAHVGLPCGGGKSMAWMVPAVARVVTQRSRKTIIVVLPYKFLSAYHLESATRLVKGSVDLDIVSLTGQDIGETSLPGCLTESNLLPHILFLSLEALQNLMRHHGPSLTDWVNAKQIHRFVVDEIHTIYSESFRPVYEQLPGLVRFGAPVMTMSGTVPRKMVPTLLRHLGMSSDPSFLDVDVVECVDAVGSFPVDFRLNVNNTPSFPVAAAVCILELLRQRPDQGIHVVASSKSIAQKVVDFLEHKCDSWRYVTSETPKDELDSVAKDWSIGSFNVLVSTSIALVGNENKKCHHVFVVGYLFNLMSVVQAIGRLRPLQRTGSATVQFWVNQWKNDRLERADEFNSSSYENLKARKLITDVDKSLFLQVASIRGLHKWLFLDQGCRLQNLAIHFGTSRRGRCGICDVCCGTVTRTLSAAATTRFEKHNGIRNKAMVVLKALLESCLYCQRESCEGEGCMKNLCYRCGSPKHFTRQCLDGKTAEDLLHARACYHCFDLYNRRGYSNHNSSDCPLKRRLRRMVFAKWPATTTTYKSFLSSNFCSEEAFCSFVASLGTGSEK